MGQYSGSVQVTGKLTPTYTTDIYPVTDPLYGIDGLRNVETNTERNNIPNLRRRAGMIVGVIETGKYWKLKNISWTGADTDWEEYTMDDFLSIDIPSGSTEIIPENKQKLVYGNLINSGTIENNENLTILNGDLVISQSATVTNNGDIEFVSLTSTYELSSVSESFNSKSTYTDVTSSTLFVSSSNLYVLDSATNQKYNIYILNGILTCSLA